MKKYLFLFVAIIVLGGGSYFSERSFLASAVPAPVSVPLDTIATTTDTAEQPTGVRQAPVQKTTRATATTSPATPAPDVTITVASSSYSLYVPPNSTVLDAMNALASTGNFTFTTKDFPGLGAFVETINGQGNESGHSWIFYVNGVESQEGISSTVLNSGDTVEWKYEQNY